MTANAFGPGEGADVHVQCRAERDALRAEVQRALEDPSQNEHDLYDEVKRLRATLEEILGHTNEYSEDIAKIARKTLAGLTTA